MLVVKYNSLGAIQWQKAILFDAGFDCYGADADIDSAGNIYVTGSYQYYDSDNDTNTSALSILKLDGNGAKQWSRRVVGNCETFGVSVVVGADDKLYLSGITGDNNDENNAFTWVTAKYGIDGTVEWQRLIDNTTGWTFTGGVFFGEGGGSNIAVKENYVLLGGGFGNLIEDIPRATVVQVSAAGDVFSIGDWDFKAASFSGVLSADASDITVVNAGKTDTDNSENISTTTAELQTEVSGFLLGTLYTVGDSNDRLVNGEYEIVLGSTGVVTLPSGGTISEGVVTDNPTIELTPANPDVTSQKLVIKGGIGDNYHLHLTNGDLTETSLIIGTDEHNIRTITDGAIQITAYDYSVQEQKYWYFSPQGSLTFPDATTQTTAFTGATADLVSTTTASITTLSNPNNGPFVGMVSANLEGDGYIVFGPAGGAEFNPDQLDGVDLTRLVGGTITQTGTGFSSPILSVTSLGNKLYSIQVEGTLATLTGGSGIGLTITVDPLTEKIWTFDTDGNVTVPGDIRSEGDINIDINLSDSTLRRWRFGEDGDLTFPDGTVQATAYLGSALSTVARTGVADLFANDMSFEVTAVDGGGVVTEVTITNTPNPAWQSNGAGTGVTFGDLSFIVQVDGSGNATVSGITSSGGHTIGETFTVGGDSFGAEILPTAIDLTKSVNKLTPGYYTLADGVEGQIMYLVRQTGLSTTVEIIVAHARNGASEYTDYAHYPFAGTSSNDLTTLIFTDGHWQSSGDSWD
jgi:hypothetical protein